MSTSGPLALALAVWMLYAADRVNDAFHGGDLMDRHLFHFQYRNAFGIALLCMVPVLGVLVLRLPHGLRGAWLLLSLPLLLYVVTVHGFRWPRLPKEMMVGLFFGVATAMPVMVSRTVAWASLLPSILLFSALGWLNGIAIARWEGSPRGTMDACTAWLTQRLTAAAACLAMASALLLLQPQIRPVAIAVLLSTGLLLSLDGIRGRVNCVHLRALADAALLTPLAVMPFLTSLKMQ